MANKMINELEAGSITAPDDLFIIQTASGDTKKLLYANFAGKLLYTDILQGGNITLTQVTDAQGCHLRIAAADTTYTNGAGLALANGAFSVKLGENLSINAETGNIDASGGGSVWHFGQTAPESPNEGDLWLRSDSGHYGEVDSYDSSAWSQVGTFAGQDGVTPHIDSTTGHWFIGSTDTGVTAEGQDGNDGAAATVTVGTVTTGSAGTNAVVTNSGTSSAAVFDFTIPRGADGTNGTDGNDGDDGASISASETAITNGHRVTISSTDPNVSDIVFDLTNGADGDDGEDGDDGTSISFATSTITGGHSITISSTDPNVNDETFNVMDGVTTIQTTSVNTLVTLAAANWQGASAPYTQTVSLSGMTSGVVPIIGLVPSAAVETGIEEQKQWTYITKAVSGTDSITFSCYKTKPTIDLTANVKAV